MNNRDEKLELVVSGVKNNVDDIKKRKKKTYSFTLDPEVVDRLKDFAAERDLSASHVLNDILKRL